MAITKQNQNHSCFGEGGSGTRYPASFQKARPVHLLVYTEAVLSYSRRVHRCRLDSPDRGFTGRHCRIQSIVSSAGVPCQSSCRVPVCVPLCGRGAAFVLGQGQVREHGQQEQPARPKSAGSLLLLCCGRKRDWNPGPRALQHLRGVVVYKQQVHPYSPCNWNPGPCAGQRLKYVVSYKQM